jgi:hypothetical protein
MQKLEFAEEQFNRSILGTLLAPPISIALGAAIGFGYAFVVNINPFIYLGFIAALLVGCALGMSVTIIMSMFGSSDRFTRIITMVTTVAGCLWMYYAQWLNLNGVPFWSVTPLLEWYTLGLIEPFSYAFEQIAPYMNYSVSTNSSGSSDIGTGGAKWFWYLEIALIAVPAAIIAIFAEGDFVNKSTGGKMKSLDETYVVAHLSTSDVDGKSTDMLKRDFSLFQTMSTHDINRIITTKGAKKKDHVPASNLELFQDSKDPSIYAVKVTTGGYTYSKDDGWVATFDLETVVDHLLINKSEYDAIVARLAG